MWGGFRNDNAHGKKLLLLLLLLVCILVIVLAGSSEANGLVQQIAPKNPLCNSAEISFSFCSALNTLLINTSCGDTESWVEGI